MNTYTAVNSEQTHTVNTHPEQWAAFFVFFLLRRPGSSWGFGVVVLKVLESAGHSFPPHTIPAVTENQTLILWVTSQTL